MVRLSISALSAVACLPLSAAFLGVSSVSPLAAAGPRKAAVSRASGALNLRAAGADCATTIVGAVCPPAKAAVPCIVDLAPCKPRYNTPLPSLWPVAAVALAWMGSVCPARSQPPFRSPGEGSRAERRTAHEADARHSQRPVKITGRVGVEQGRIGLTLQQFGKDAGFEDTIVKRGEKVAPWPAALALTLHGTARRARARPGCG